MFGSNTVSTITETFFDTLYFARRFTRKQGRAARGSSHSIQNREQ